MLDIIAQFCKLLLIAILFYFTFVVYGEFIIIIII